MVELGSGKLLGKYLTATSAVAVLTNMTLRWTRPALFNDPFDSRPVFQFGVSRADATAGAMAEFRKVVLNQVTLLSIENSTARLLSALRESIESGSITYSNCELLYAGFIEDFLISSEKFSRDFFSTVVMQCQDIKILCLSKDLNQRLMWSHYADSHRGALLVFSPRSPDSIFGAAEDVNYTNQDPAIFDSDDFGKVMSGQLSLTDIEYIRRIFKRITLTKSFSWAYERESRITLGISDRPNEEVEYLGFQPADLVAIIFGLSASQDFIKVCVEISKKRYGGAKLLQSHRSSTVSGFTYREL